MTALKKLLEGAEHEGLRRGRWKNSNAVPTQCPGCGRFAKHLGGHHYYNGSYNCYSFDTSCSRCGVLTTECV